MKIEPDLLCPRLLRATYFSAYNENYRDSRLVPRRCYDYELEYYTASDGGIIMDGDYVEFGPDEINFRRPGQVVCGVLPYSCYIICFSMGPLRKKPEDYTFGSPAEAEPDYETPLLGLLPAKIVPEQTDAVETLFRDICRSASNSDDLSRFRANCQLSALMLQLFSGQWNKSEILYNRRVLPAVEYIKDNFCEEIPVRELIEKSGLSKTYFHKCFKACTHTTPMSLIMELRMEKAKTLLQITGDKIADIAMLCGYLDSVYFTHLFKRAMGMTPTQYRRQMRDTVGG